MELTDLLIADAAVLIQRRELSPRQLVQACLNRIKALDPQLNSFITLTADTAIQEAIEAEKVIGQGDYRGLLHGIPIALKDLYETKGVLTTAGSKFFADNIPSEDSEVVRRLNAAGAIILGKLNMHEWAYGVTNVTSNYGPPKNPWNLDFITGGSSGGSGAALAADLCLGATGSDTGGSIRIPAALCGIVGLKPTFGRVSTRGVIPLSWSLDHAGPMARSVRDVAILLQALAGFDNADPGSANVPGDDYLANIAEGVRGWRIGLVHGEYFSEVDSDISQSVQAAAKVFENLGAQLVDIKLETSQIGTSASRVVLTSGDAAAFHRMRLATHPEDFGGDVLPRLKLGLTNLAADYGQARREQTVVQRQFDIYMADSGCDILLTPTLPVSAVRRDDPIGMERARTNISRFTGPFNVLGVPALSVPCGFNSDGIPIGLQLIAPRWKESQVLRAGYAYEQATEWHKRKPTFPWIP